MALSEATDLRCANLATHLSDPQRPQAVAIVQDPRWPANHWRFRCRDCVSALNYIDDLVYQVAWLHRHHPGTDDDLEPDNRNYDIGGVPI